MITNLDIRYARRRRYSLEQKGLDYASCRTQATRLDLLKAYFMLEKDNNQTLVQNYPKCELAFERPITNPRHPFRHTKILNIPLGAEPVFLAQYWTGEPQG